MGELFDAARQGGRAAEREIHRLLRVLARAVCHGRGPAGAADVGWEDVAQEAGRKLFTKGLDRHRGQGSEKSYLYTIVKTTAIELGRAAQRRKRREDGWAALAPGSGPEPGVRIEVQTILSRLSEACRNLLRSAFLQDVSYADLSRRLGLAESSVRSKVSRCIGKARAIAHADRDS